MFGVFSDVLGGCLLCGGVVEARLELDQAVVLQQIQGTAEVGHVIGHGDGALDRHIGEAFMALGINAQRLDMHGRGHGKFLPQSLLLRLQIRQVLGVVGIDISVGQQLVGVDAAGEFDHLDLQFRVDLAHVFQNLRMGHRVCCYSQGFQRQCIVRRQQAAEHRQGQSCLFEHGQNP